MAPADLASTLDMSLDDVIKSKGKRSGGRGPKKGGAGEQGGGRKAAPGGKPKEGGSKPTEEKAGGRGGKPLRRVTAAKAIAPAAKAAAAAAKATAATTAGTAGGAEQAASQDAKAPAAAATAATARTKKAAAAGEASKPVAAPKHTEDKLGMSLEDLVKFNGKRGAAAPKAAATGADEKGAGRTRGGKRRLMKLRSTPKGKAKAKAKAKGKAKAKAQGGRRAVRGSWGGGGADLSFLDPWGGGGQESWRRGNDFVTWESRRKPSGGGLYADWGAGGKRRGSDDWSTPAKRPRAAGGPWGDAAWGWGEGAAGWGTGRQSALALTGGGAARWPGERWGGQEDPWGGSGAGIRSSAADSSWGRALARAWGSTSVARGSTVRRASMDSSAAPRGSSERACRVRVSNVPKNLDWRDIKEAFEDTGRVIRCEVERGVAWITFQSSGDAKKAVQTFDRGELNGQTIFVTHE